NDYNPLYHYVLWVYGHMMGSVDKIVHYCHYLKAYTLVFDFAGAWWAASLVSERQRRFGLSLLLLLNAGYLYNTLIWVQVDAIYTFFSFGAVVLAARQRPVGSLLLYVLALMAKTQAIIFLPPLLLLWLPQGYHRPRQLAAGLLASAALATLVLAPFIWGGWENYLPRLLYLNLHAAGRIPYISVHAYNIWYLISSSDTLHETLDTLPFGGLTYHAWGLIWFLMASAVVLLPLLAAAWRRLRSPGGTARPELALVLLSCGAVPLVFCFFNTQMHERYWHPAVLFLAAYGFVRRDYLPLVLVSVANFLQLEKILAHLHLVKYTVLIFKDVFIAGLFALLILLVVFKLYRMAPWRLGVATRPAPAMQ
ncbi:MAG: hypothetical protein ACRYFX_16075, partial [Janthinobacterium lividum]